MKLFTVVKSKKRSSHFWRSGLIMLMITWSFYGLGQVDSTYIQKLPNQKVFGVLTSFRHFKLQFDNDLANGKYFQVTDLGFGIRFKYKKIGASISIPVIRLNNSNSTPPKSLGLQLRWYPTNYFVSGRFQTIRGMNTLDPITGDLTLDPSANVQYGTLAVVRILNPTQWTMRSSFRSIDIQRKNAGSWLLSAMTEYQHLRSSSSENLSEEETDLDLKQYKAWRWSLGGGYGYTFVLPKFYISTLALLGPELRSVVLTTSHGDEKRTAVRLNPRILTMASMIHNTNDFFYGIVGSYQPSIHRGDNVDAGTENVRVRFTIGWRFDEGPDFDLSD